MQKLERMAFALEAPEYFKDLTERLEDGVDRSNYKFVSVNH